MDAGLLGSAVELSWAAGEGCVIPYLVWLGLDKRFAGFVFFLNPIAVIVLQPLVGHLSDHGAALGPAFDSKMRLVVILSALTCLGFGIIVLSLRLGNIFAYGDIDPAFVAIGLTFVGYFVMDVSNDLLLIPARNLCLGEATLAKTRRRRNARFTVLQCVGRFIGMSFGVLPWENFLFNSSNPTIALSTFQANVANSSIKEGRLMDAASANASANASASAAGDNNIVGLQHALAANESVFGIHEQSSARASMIWPNNDTGALVANVRKTTPGFNLTSTRSPGAQMTCTDPECTHAQVMMTFAIVYLSTMVVIMLIRRLHEHFTSPPLPTSRSRASSANVQRPSSASSQCESYDASIAISEELISESSRLMPTVSSLSAATAAAAEAEALTSATDPVVLYGSTVNDGHSSSNYNNINVNESESESGSESEDESEDGEELGMIDSLKAVAEIAGHHPTFRHFFLVQLTGWCAIMYQVFFWTDWVRGTHVVFGYPLRLSFIGLALQAVLSLITAILLPRINRWFGPVLVYFAGQLTSMLGLMLAILTGPGPWSIVVALMLAPGYVTHTNNCYIVAFRALEKPKPNGNSVATNSNHNHESGGGGGGNNDSNCNVEAGFGGPVNTGAGIHCSSVHENKGSVVAAVNMAMPAAQILVGGLAGVALSAVGDNPARVLFGIGLVGAVINVCAGAIVIPKLSGRVRPRKSRTHARRASY